MTDATERWSDAQVALVDLVDRVIGGGVVITGDVVLGVAGVDLVYLGLRLVLAPAHEVEQSVVLGRRSA
jgi:Gas vesicle protein